VPLRQADAGEAVTRQSRVEAARTLGQRGEAVVFYCGTKNCFNEPSANAELYIP
jgi:hypothetical protein